LGALTGAVGVDGVLFRVLFWDVLGVGSDFWVRCGVGSDFWVLCGDLGLTGRRLIAVQKIKSDCIEILDSILELQTFRGICGA